MKTIKLKSKNIVIPFQDEEGNVLLELSFKRDDKILVGIIESIEDVTRGFQEYEDSEEFDYKAAKKRVEEAIDAWLGEGTFNKLYDLQPSLTQVVDLATQIVEILGEELANVVREKEKAIEKYFKK